MENALKIKELEAENQQLRTELAVAATEINTKGRPMKLIYTHTAAYGALYFAIVLGALFCVGYIAGAYITAVEMAECDRIMANRYYELEPH